MRLTRTMALLGAVVELCGMSKRNREFPAGIGLIDRRLVGTVVTNNAQQSRRTGLDATETPRAVRSGGVRRGSLCLYVCVGKCGNHSTQRVPAHSPSCGEM